MSNARFLVGDVFDMLATLPDNSVDLVVTSPPFLALRSYLPADHPDKGKEIGSEPTPAAFIDTLLDVVEALDRVLAPHGSIVIELGDTYSSEGTSKPMTFANPKHVYSETKGRTSLRGHDGWPLDKSLCLVPQSFAWALAYGRNPFNGRQTARWRVRNIIRWCRPNPPVGALGDKFRPATSEMVVACKSRDRYFDLDAVRTESDTAGMVTTRGPRGRNGSGVPGGDADWQGSRSPNNPAGAPPLDFWVIPTEPYEGAHYATFPRALVVKPIASMCPSRVCRQCGQPSRRIVERSERYAAARDEIGDFNQRGRDGKGVSGSRSVLNAAAGADITCAEHITLGWSDCGHDDWRPGMVLDPFAGSGTTLAVAVGHGRDAIGIDLDERNAELARDRVGPLFLEVA